MTRDALQKLLDLLSKAREVSSALKSTHHISCLRDDATRRQSMMRIIAEIGRCYRRPGVEDTYPYAVAYAVRYATDCFKRGQLSHPMAVARYLSYLMKPSNTKDCRYQSDLEMFFTRFQYKLAQKYNRERRKAERALSSEDGS